MLQDAENVDSICFSLFFSDPSVASCNFGETFFKTFLRLFFRVGAALAPFWLTHWCCFLYPLWHAGRLYTLHHCTGTGMWWEEDRVTGDPSDVYISNVSPSFPPCHLPILPLLPLSNTDSNTHIYKYTHANTVGILGYWLFALRISQHHSSSLSWSASNMSTTWINHKWSRQFERQLCIS